MLIARMEPGDHARVLDLLQGSGAEVDLTAEQERSWACSWVARQSEADPVIAFLLVWFVADEVQIQYIVTHPDSRRLGAASALLSVAVRHAADRHASKVLLEVRRTNTPAIQLYRSRGFHVIGVRRGYYGRDGEDALEMMLTLNPQTGDVEPGRDLVSVLDP